MDFFFSLYRILPFMLTAFFLFSFIMSGSVSGILVFVGILLSSLLVSAISQSEWVIKQLYGVSNSNELNNPDNLLKMKRCNLISLPNSVLSYLPLSTHTFAFVLGYLITTSIHVKLMSKWTAIVPLIIILFYDIFYNSTMCLSFIPTMVLAFFSAGLGVAWAFTIGKSNWFTPHLSKQSKCNITDAKYNCIKTN